ncbi:MAG: rhomboid family intramembrane serine protease [Pseudomonadota bacterium]|jgi:membrane associated rhomboid family serine protease
MFIPIGDDNTRRHRTPYVVWLLVAANAAVWMLELNLGQEFIASFATIPLEISTGTDIVSTRQVTIQGERFPIVHGPGPVPIYLTLLTSMFMHGSWGHIIGNMVYLIIFGDQIEDRYGHLKFLLFYLIAGVVASLAHVAADPSSILPCVGASGAIAGVLGAYFIMHPSNTVRVLIFRDIIHLPAFIVLGFWGAMQIFGHFGNPSSGGGVAYMAHVGGFVVGVVVALIGRTGRLMRR